jgi:Rrf2 family iron-sulfur cluster assembly transcriptional regulator|tara:strand:- start:9736 stop:10179 length:444 start_codon:yes stop_codon:yes gene_type:complete
VQIGKTAQNAVAAVSYLAECYRDKLGSVSSQAVADARGLSKPLAAKILTTLSQSGLVKGSTGPGGGYELEVEPSEIRLLDVVKHFELQNKAVMCPFGEGWCGNYDPCPLHDNIMKLGEDLEQFLVTNNFGKFALPGCSSKRSAEGGK